MNKEELKLLIESQMKDDIDSVLSGKSKFERLLGVRPSKVINYLKTLDNDLDEGQLETNGWEWDFWIPISYNGKAYILSGDGYYNDTINFALEGS